MAKKKSSPINPKTISLSTFLSVVTLFLFFLGSLEAKSFSLKLEHARTSDEKTIGLMGRKEIPEDTGMLFYYPEGEIISLWSFNCFCDLSVAFLDKDQKILEFQDLFAYPEKMDPRRPIHQLKDLKRYSYWDPICQFFSKNRIVSSQPAYFALEVPLGWFKRKEIDIGDQLK